MGTDYENGVNAKLPTKLGIDVMPVSGNATAGYFFQFNGVGLTGSQVPAISLAQTVVVAKAGGQFTTIQAAIDSITDATITKPYVVLIYPGTYAENLTLKNWVHLQGFGGQGNSTIPSVNIIPASGIVFNIPSQATQSNIQILDIAVNVSNPTTAIDYTVFYFQGGGGSLINNVSVYNCYISVATKGNLKAIDMAADAAATFYATGSSFIFASIVPGGPSVQTLFNLNNVSGAKIVFSTLSINNNVANSTTTLFYDNTAGSLGFDVEYCNLTMVATSAAGTKIFAKAAGSAASWKFINNTIITGKTSGSTTMTVNVFDLSVPTSGITTLQANTVVYAAVTPATKNYCITGTGVVVNSTLDVIAGMAVSGTGTFNKSTFSPSAGQLQLGAGPAVSDLSLMPYTAAVSGNWLTSAPTNLKDAVDRIAALAVTLNSGNPIP